MEALVWETAEELDKKVAEHLRNIANDVRYLNGV